MTEYDPVVFPRKIKGDRAPVDRGMHFYRACNLLKPNIKLYQLDWKLPNHHVIQATQQ